MYKPLYRRHSLAEEDSIRLIVFPPAERSAPLRAHLVTATTSEMPEYQALSYVWGDPTPVDAIICEDTPVLIAANLRDALLRIRSETETLIIWVDAICIDQRSLDEREHQVSIMGKIYEQASSVLVYVGQGLEGDPRLVKDNIAIFRAMLLQKLSQGQRLIDAVKGLPDPDVEKGLAKNDYSAWQRFWDLPYWERAWVVQEAGLAAKAEILYGDESIDWEDLMLSCTWLAYFGHLRFISSGSSVRSSWVGYNQSKRAQFSTRPSDYAPDISFLDCLDCARRGSRATDPRDLVYAFLGHPGAHKFSPNYHVDTKAVYRDFAASCLNAHQNPSILSYSTRSPELGLFEDVPGWCPVWNEVEDPPEPLLGLNRSRGYNASNGAPFKYSIDNNLLSVTGIVFDCLDFAAGPVRSHHLRAESEGADINPLIEAFQRSVADPDRCGKNYPDLTRAFATTVTAAACQATFDPSQSPTALLSQAELSRWIGVLEHGRGYHASLHRSFFTTREGYMGIGPPQLKAGDFCCVIAGARTPFVARLQKDSTYRLLGECYIEGVMGGEIFTRTERGDLAETTLVLC